MSHFVQREICGRQFNLYQTPRPLPCCLRVLRQAPVSLIASIIVTRLCSRVNSIIRSDSSGSVASTIFSRSTFFSRRRTSSARERKKNTSHGCQLHTIKTRCTLLSKFTKEYANAVQPPSSEDARRSTR